MRASVLTKSVLAKPGTPSIKTWPFASTATRTCSTVPSCPEIAFATSDRMILAVSATLMGNEDTEARRHQCALASASLSKACLSMSPLVFLFTRSFANGVRRALTSPRRTISLIFFGLYYYWLIMRPFMPQPHAPGLQGIHSHFSMPSRYVLDGIVFALMAFVSLFMLAGILTYRGGFRPADVDVLFPTPINPKLVLLFRMARDYLLTLVVPLLFGILGYRGARIGFQSLIANYPAHGADMMRMTWLAWMFMALAWVSIGYATSMFVGRSDLQSDKNRKVIIFGILGLNVVTALYIAYALHQNLSWATALRVSHSWLLRLLILPATAAASVATGGIEGDWTTFALGTAGLVGLIVLAFAAAFSQVSWMYDQAAARGFDAINMRKLRRGGMSYALMAEMARRGRVHPRWLDQNLSRLNFRGPVALVWKEQVLQTRGMLGLGVLLGIITIGVVGLCAFLARSIPSDTSGIFLVSVMCGLSYFYSVCVSFSGFQEMLRRVDLLKPLPFSSAKILFWELAGKLPFPAATLILAGLVAAIINPSSAQTAAAGSLMSVAMLLEISGAILFTVTLFPDYEDPTQRGLSMIFMLVSILICSSPGLGLYFALTLLAQLPPFVSALPSAILLLAITAGLATVAGSIYAGFNPTE